MAGSGSSIRQWLFSVEEIGERLRVGRSDAGHIVPALLRFQEGIGAECNDKRRIVRRRIVPNRVDERSCHPGHFRRRVFVGGGGLLNAYFNIGF